MADETRASKDARIAELEEELATARAAAAAPEAEAGASTKMLEVLDALVAKVGEIAAPGAQAGAGQSFARGETAMDVERSLRGTVTTGEHSGRKTDYPVTFRSRGSDFLMIRKARHRHVNESGEAVVTTGVHYSFAPTGTFVTDDEDVVDYIRTSPGFNAEVFEVGNEPDRTPDAGPVLDRIIDARIQLDVETLDRLEHEERSGYQRPQVLEAIAASRRSMERGAREIDEALS
jgi:hypothetical protein